MPTRPLQLIQGTLDLLVLRALTAGPRHGYGVLSWLRSASDDNLLLEEGALYPALHRLEEKDLIEAEWGQSENNRRAKFYRLTRAGRARLREEQKTWHRYVDMVGRVLEAT